MWDVGSVAFLVLGVLAAVAAGAGLLAGARFSRQVRSAVFAERGSAAVAVLAPVRHVDAAAIANIEVLLSQEYPSYSVVFAVDSDDPATAKRLAEAIARHTTEARIVISNGPRGGSGKAAALARAAEELEPSDVVVVTYDADARPHRRWLAELVAGLEGDRVGAATAYRWYTARGGFWSAVRSSWNGSGYNVFFDDRYNFCWGGSTAVRRELFDAAGIREQWPSTLSDDLVITRAVKDRGLRVQFVPRAVCVSDEPSTKQECVRWTTQQAAFVYAYYPRLTTFALGAYAIFDGAVVLGILGALLAMLVAPEYAWGALLMLLDIPVTVVRAEQRRRALAAALPEWREALAADRGRYLLASLVVPWLMLVNLWRVRRLESIEWKGRTYPMPPRKSL